MVSSSPTKVTPLPTMRGNALKLGPASGTAEPMCAGEKALNGQATVASSKEPPSPLANGSASIANVPSESSTGDSTYLSPQSNASNGEERELASKDQDRGSDPALHESRGLQTPEASPKINGNFDNSSPPRDNGTKVSTEHTHLRPDTLPNRPRKPSQSTRQSSTSKRAAAVAAAQLNDDVLIGTRVSEGHENFVTAYNMLTGIRVAVSRCTAKINRPLTDADFKATDEISFDMSGGGHSPSSKYIFQFKDYAPWVFRHLRDVFRLDPADYLMSLTAKYIVSELGSPGKSGSFFYYSRDYRFIIKTIRHSEHKLLRRILRQYFAHVKANPDTLVSQFYGLHRVKLPFGRKIHFVVMNNVFPALYEIHERYDLKGSLLGREYHPDLSKPIVVYKDLDWLRRHRRIVLGPEKRERLVRQLELDVRFLQRVNVMDYSLLIGIHDMSKGNAALKALLKLEEFGPQDSEVSEIEKRDANAAINKRNVDARTRNKTSQKDFADLQTLLKKANPEKLKEFDFADEYRSEFYFYRDHGGFQSTSSINEELDVIYYVGVIDFLTGYTFRKSVETFCKGLIHDRKELSAVPAAEYGDRFLKFLRGCIGPAISSSKPQKRVTDDSTMSRTSEPSANNKASQPTLQNHSQSQSLERPTTAAPAAPDARGAAHFVQSSQPPLPHSQAEAIEAHLNAAHEFPQKKPNPDTVHLQVNDRPVSGGSTPSPSKTVNGHSPNGHSPQCTAMTSPSANGATTAKPRSPTSDSKRRPSVAGYGPDVFRDSSIGTSQ